MAGGAGGHALAWLHDNAGRLLSTPDATPRGQGAPVRVHMDALACMTGVTRFGQVMPHWEYFKVGPPPLPSRVFPIVVRTRSVHYAACGVLAQWCSFERALRASS